MRLFEISVGFLLACVPGQAYSPVPFLLTTLSLTQQDKYP
jgi:hypothetical protein